MKPFRLPLLGNYKLLPSLLALCCACFAAAQTTQPLLFNDTPTTTAQMTTGQLSTYNKLSASGDFSEIRVIQFNTLAAAEQEGVVKVNIVNGLCGEVVFRPVGVNYNDENNYFYYGRMDPKSGCDCTDGEISITKTGGAIAGDIRIGDKLYIITDLGGGKQALGKSPDNYMTICEGAVELPSLHEHDEDVIDNRSGPTCNIRVLFMVTASASGVIPNISLFVNANLNKLNQAILNSGIGSSNANFVLAGIASAPADFTEAGNVPGGVLFSLYHNYDEDTFLEPYGADIGVIILDPGIMAQSSTQGAAALGGRWMVMKFKENDASRTFVHEAGHLLKADHQSCSPPPATTGCLSNSGSAHAHFFTSGCNDKNRKTAMFSHTSNDMILHYSNPNIDFQGVPTGITGVRDNASIIRGFGCTAANHSPLFDDAFSVSINGPLSGCKGSFQTYTANVSGNGLGSLSYEWRMAIGGVNYGSVFSTNSTVTIQLPATSPNMVSLRVKVTSSLQGFKEATNYINVANCGGLKPDKPTGGSSKIMAVNAFPNPSHGDILFEVTVSEDVQNGRLTILDQYGTIIKTIPIESISNANPCIIGNINSLATGLYSYQLSFSDNIQAGKFCVIR